MTEQIGYSIAISFSSIQKLGIGYYGKPCQSTFSIIFYLPR